MVIAASKVSPTPAHQKPLSSHAESRLVEDRELCFNNAIDKSNQIVNKQGVINVFSRRSCCSD